MTNGTRTGSLTESPWHYNYEWDAVTEYARLVNDSVQLFNIIGNVSGLWRWLSMLLCSPLEAIGGHDRCCQIHSSPSEAGDCNHPPPIVHH